MTDELERWLQRVLRELPSRRAPGTLQARVLGELQRRAVQPWWRRSFAHWPLPARLAFVAICIGCTGLALLGGDWTVTALGSLGSGAAKTMLPVQQAWGLISAVARRLMSSIWLYPALSAAAALYAMLFGLGAVAYRTLYLEPSSR